MELNLKNPQRGQTLVEYILLLSVATSLVLTFYNSRAFKSLFGDQGSLGKNIKQQNEFAYRHAFSVTGPSRSQVQDIDRNNREASIHPSYKGDPTRFFGPLSTYGN
jgi:hypothetical protein